MPGPARELHTQQVHYLRKRVNYNDASIGSGVVMGTLPAGAMIVSQNVRVSTAFNAGTTNALNVGTASQPEPMRLTMPKPSISDSISAPAATPKPRSAQ